MAEKTKEKITTENNASDGGYATSSASEGVTYIVYPDEANNSVSSPVDEETKKRIHNLLHKLGSSALESAKQNSPELQVA
ncbi:hypothetical protein IJG04_02485 [Candidatus Saccharibacteria bacterium]|nr:hypothetical protein [Candidatus Saccharibacteria bacterium]